MWVRNHILESNKTADGLDRYKYADILAHAKKHNIAVDGDIRQITKVLIVDDDSFVADFLKDFLESREVVYEVHRTGISFMADKLMKKFHPHVVILDLRMPGMNGIEALEKIKKHSANLPVVMITKSEEESIMEDAIGSNIADYLIKPVKPSQILLSL
ncbi:MAG: hypothetical protein DRQ47_10660, partial [Gammaproteobacteria bacterium]